MAENTAVEETQTDEAEVIPTLDLRDLAVVLNLLNAAIKRGAYEPKELSDVGLTYNKLEAFLQYQAKRQAATQEAEETQGEA